LDAFAGSGTTGHAVLQQNAADGGNRRCILIEVEPNVAENITAERVRRVSGGYTNAKGEMAAGLGGGFRYCTLGEPLFDAEGRIREGVTFSELAQHIFFTETGGPPNPAPDGSAPLLGEANGTAYYLLWGGVPDGNILNAETLRALACRRGPKVVFADGCTLSPSRRKRANIVFRQIPYEVKTR
jgi:site-specific DNA-methyltransferase (adenine-specific)/adenine-specific DNA-methyltransferase